VGAAEADQISVTNFSFPVYSLMPYCCRYQQSVLFLNLCPSKPPLLVTSDLRSGGARFEPPHGQRLYYFFVTFLS